MEGKKPHPLGTLTQIDNSAEVQAEQQRRLQQWIRQQQLHDRRLQEALEKIKLTKPR